MEKGKWGLTPIEITKYTEGRTREMKIMVTIDNGFLIEWKDGTQEKFTGYIQYKTIDERKEEMEKIVYINDCIYREKMCYDWILLDEEEN